MAGQLVDGLLLGFDIGVNTPECPFEVTVNPPRGLLHSPHAYFFHFSLQARRMKCVGLSSFSAEHLSHLPLGLHGLPESLTGEATKYGAM